MPQIRFTSNPKIPTDMAEKWAGYVKDSVHEVSSSEVDRWLRRGVAEVFVPPAVVSRAHEPKPEVKPEVVSKVEEIVKVEEKDVPATPVGAQTETSKPQTPIPSPAAPRTR